MGLYDAKQEKVREFTEAEKKPWNEWLEANANMTSIEKLITLAISAPKAAEYIHTLGYGYELLNKARAHAEERLKVARMICPEAENHTWTGAFRRR